MHIKCSSTSQKFSILVFCDSKSDLKMTAFDREFEKEIKEVGNTLLNPPSSIDDLLTFLDKVENLLAYMEQEPSKSMRDALLPLVKALITNKLL